MYYLKRYPKSNFSCSLRSIKDSTRRASATNRKFLISPSIWVPKSAASHFKNAGKTFVKCLFFTNNRHKWVNQVRRDDNISANDVAYVSESIEPVLILLTEMTTYESWEKLATCILRLKNFKKLKCSWRRRLAVATCKVGSLQATDAMKAIGSALSCSQGIARFDVFRGEPESLTQSLSPFASNLRTQSTHQ